MKKLTRYEIEEKVMDIAWEVADTFGLEMVMARQSYYGDCLPSEIMKLENDIELDQDLSLFDDVREIFEECARSWCFVEVEDKKTQNTNIGMESTDLDECIEYAHEIWNQLTDKDKKTTRINVFPAFNVNRESAECELVLEM